MTYKIKLAAIAKDEAAYLPEWIHHHLYFGFDCIEIYINNTTDNSYSVIEKIKQHYPVDAVDADYLFAKYKVKFQARSYQEIAIQAKKDGFTHLMFLDIDEFWTPKDFTSSISSAIHSLPQSDVYLFNWFIHTDESDFSHCFKSSIRGQSDRHLKYLVDLQSNFKPEVHNAIGNLTYCNANGQTIEFDKGDMTRAHVVSHNAMADNYFVIHRLYRSQMEYVSMLYRGRPKGDSIKNNRFGYYQNTQNSTHIEFDKHLIDKYLSDYDSFIEKCALNEDLSKSRLFVEERYKKLIDFTQTNINKNDARSLVRALNNIALPEILTLRASMMLNNQKIFQIGFNKSGSASIFDFMKSNGFASVHWERGQLSEQLKENHKAGTPLLSGYENYQVFTDMEHREKDQSAFYSYQHYFQDLDKQYPDSIFILNYRDVDKWIKGRIYHPGYLERCMSVAGVSTEEVIDQWKQHFYKHISSVKSYFKDRDNLITLDLDNDKKDKLYHELAKRGFNLAHKTLPTKHVTKKTKKAREIHIDNLRDAALYFENHDLELALSLMQIAANLRPSGKVINDKIKVYESKIIEANKK